jgi:hypothetical protein
MASGDLFRVDLGLTVRDDLNLHAGPVDVFLFGDAGGSPDSANQTMLGSGTPTVLNGMTNSSLVMVSVAGNVPVTMGSTYWLVLETRRVPGKEVRDFWNFSEPVVTGSVAGSNNAVDWTVRTPRDLPAFRIITFAPIPDSGWTLLLMLISIPVLLVLQRVLRNERSS